MQHCNMELPLRFFLSGELYITPVYAIDEQVVRYNPVFSCTASLSFFFSTKMFPVFPEAIFD